MPSSVRVQLGAALAARNDGIPDASTRRLMSRAARAALRRDSVRDAELSITLLDDAEIAAMNREFLSHEGPTDVISFSLYEEGEDPVGDIYVGFDEAMRHARAHGVEPGEELARLAVHGTLHVLGYDHPEGKARLSSDMWQIQETILAQVLAP